MSHRIHPPTFAIIVTFIIVGAGCAPAGADPERMAAGSPDVLAFALRTNNGATSEQIKRVMRLANAPDGRGRLTR